MASIHFHLAEQIIDPNLLLNNNVTIQVVEDKVGSKAKEILTLEKLTPPTIFGYHPKSSIGKGIANWMHNTSQFIHRNSKSQPNEKISNFYKVTNELNKIALQTIESVKSDSNIPVDDKIKKLTTLKTNLLNRNNAINQFNKSFFFYKIFGHSPFACKTHNVAIDAITKQIDSLEENRFNITSITAPNSAAINAMLSVVVLIAHSPKKIIESEGIFRLSGRDTLIKEIVKKLSRDPDAKEKITREALNALQPDDAAGVFKALLKNLNPHLLPINKGLRDRLEKFKIAKDDNSKIKIMNDYEASLSRIQTNIITMLLNLTAKVIENKETTKMDPKNLAIVFGPSLFDFENLSMEESLKLNGDIINFVSFLFGLYIGKK